MEMAEFMTTNKTTVFRRFDEIHVRLLLQLQDEITALERALKKIEDAGSSSPEQSANKASILRDLRKILAEYGKPSLTPKYTPLLTQARPLVRQLEFDASKQGNATGEERA